jgi:fatty-acyl-CoA synthase
MQMQPTTSTLKIRKVELKQQGFDPAEIREPLFVLLHRDKGYEALTAEIFHRIQDGSLKL